jgi:sigma-B regulation protein RsbU (phosphoserine phosphatase)
VTEATDAGLELFGEERLLETMAMAGEGTSCRQLIESILQRVDGFSGDAPVADDITLLAVKRLTSGPDWRWDVAGTPEDCAAALDNLEGWLAGHGADERLLYVARLALEELATNALKLSLPAGGSAHAEFSLKPPALSFEDSGPPFDPWSGARVPDTSAPIADREPGGLGLHLIRSLAAAVFYTHRDGSNFTRVEFDKNPKN